MSWFSFEICRILICEICNDIDLGLEQEWHDDYAGFKGSQILKGVLRRFYSLLIQSACKCCLENWMMSCQKLMNVICLLVFTVSLITFIS